jgi:hypothetical protein
MQRYNFRLTLIVVAIVAIVIGTSNFTGAAARVTNLTESYVKQLITNAINAVVPGMIDEAIDAQVPGMIDTLIDSKVPGMIETRLNELSAPTGGDPVNPVVNPVIVQNPLAGALNVRDYGAKGDGVTDDTAAINAAITAANAKGGGTVYVPDGIYKIPLVAYRNVDMKSNVALLMHDNAILKGFYDPATYVANSAVVRARDVSNIEIRGGTIWGCKQELDTANEICHGIAIQGVTNATISGVTSKWNRGDGIFIGASSSQLYSGNVLVERFMCEYNNRQGVTIESGRNVTIRDGQCNNQYLSYPMSGIDIEPVNNNWYVDNVVIDNVICTANGIGYPHASYCYGIEVGFGWWHLNGGNTNGTPISLTISNCRLFGNGNSQGDQLNTDNIAVYLTSPALNIDHITLANNTYV